VNRILVMATLLFCAACGRGGDGAVRQGTEMPVAINSESPFQYPADLFDQGVEGEVRLRLFVDSLGRVVQESTRVASSSGTSGFDSVAVRGAVEGTMAVLDAGHLRVAEKVAGSDGVPTRCPPRSLASGSRAPTGLALITAMVPGLAPPTEVVPAFCGRVT
jgi:TonB family protein